MMKRNTLLQMTPHFRLLFSLMLCLCVYSQLTAQCDSPPLILEPDDVHICNAGESVEICARFPEQILLLGDFEATDQQIYSFFEDAANNNNFSYDMPLPGISGWDSYTYGMDIDPISGLLYIVASPDGDDSNRQLYTYDLCTCTLTGPLGQIMSSSGSDKVQAITFDGAGNLWGSFNGGILEIIDLTTTTGIANTFPALPSNGQVGLTWDFDNNQILYTTDGDVYGVNTTTGASTLLQTFSSICGGNLQGLDYAGGGQLYITMTFGCDEVHTADINTGASTLIFNPTATFGAGPDSFKDLVFIPSGTLIGANAVWTDNMGNQLGSGECMTLSPTTTTTYTVNYTDNDCMSNNSEGTITVTATESAVEAAGGLVCLGEPFTLDATLGDDAICDFVAWVTDPNDVVGTTVSTTNPFDVNPTMDITYYAIVDCNGTICSDDVVITIEDPETCVPPECMIQAEIVMVECDDQGNTSPFDDLITFSVAITDNGQGSTTGWTDNQATPQSGTYGNVATYTVLATNTVNITYTDATEMDCTASITLTAYPCATSDEVPTVGEWGLIMLGLLMLITAVVGIRQRRDEEATA